MPKIIINEAIKFLSHTAVIVLVISTRNGFQVLFDKIASVHVMQAMQILKSLYLGNREERLHRV